jgi:rhodanese-related sulfurtransferase
VDGFTADSAGKDGLDMVDGIGRETVRQLCAEGAQLVDVLPAAEYEQLHIAGAINVPLKELARMAPRVLERGREVIVYCNDFA